MARFARQNAIALLALFVALGGSAYAAAGINGASIKNGTIAAKKLKRHTLTAKQINLAKLGAVPSASYATSAGSATSATTASSATNASDLGGLPASSYLTGGCATSAIDGAATIDGSATSFPSTYTSSSPFLINGYDCSGQTVEVRESAAGVYELQFPGSPATIGVGNVEACILDEGPSCLARDPDTVTVTHIPAGEENDAGGFQVIVRDSTNGDTTNAEVEVVIVGA
jgi:hypothetical protein